MDFSGFADIPVTDGHIHFPHYRLAGDLLSVLREGRIARANLVATPDLQSINQNPAVLYFKACHPDCTYICGALDYAQALAGTLPPAKALAAQVERLAEIGFDGLKMVEGKPVVRRMVPFPFDGPEMAGLWAALEERDMPLVFHVADPEEFWDPALCPDWARAQGWFYGDGSYPSKEGLYAEVERVLARHPRLKVAFAHFYFLSANLPRAAAFLDAHPNVCLDLTPGIEMYVNFSRDPDAARTFFLKYQDRLIYGTDIGAEAFFESDSPHLDMGDSLGRTWIVRRFLEGEGEFAAPPELGHGLGMDCGLLRGIALPKEVLEKVYHTNFARQFGAAPAPLDRQAALAELERMAATLDGWAGTAVESAARQVARLLADPSRKGGGG
jgi:predicted TIM-barrel fold metal-dependent hydrolase